MVGQTDGDVATHASGSLNEPEEGMMVSPLESDHWRRIGGNDRMIGSAIVGLWDVLMIMDQLEVLVQVVVVKQMIL